jgi:hypothetical protein
MTGQKQRILIVDDMPGNLRICKGQTLTLGCESRNAVMATCCSPAPRVNISASMACSTC